MKRTLIAGVAATLRATTTFAMAQTTVIEERTRPAGPAESVGSAAGGVVDSAIAVPGAVVKWITGQPARSVRIERQVVVGEPLPDTVVIRPVPEHREYSYAVVNDRRLIVEPRTRKVIRIIE